MFGGMYTRLCRLIEVGSWSQVSQRHLPGMNWSLSDLKGQGTQLQKVPEWGIAWNHMNFKSWRWGFIWLHPGFMRGTKTYAYLTGDVFWEDPKRTFGTKKLKASPKLVPQFYRWGHGKWFWGNPGGLQDLHGSGWKMEIKDFHRIPRGFSEDSKTDLDVFFFFSFLCSRKSVEKKPGYGPSITVEFTRCLSQDWFGNWGASQFLGG